MSGAERPDFQAGSARIFGLDGRIVGSQSSNVRSSVRTGVGVYEITLDPPCDPFQHVMKASILAAAADATDSTIDPVSDSLVRVRTTGIVAGAVAPVDADFYFSIERVST